MSAGFASARSVSRTFVALALSVAWAPATGFGPDTALAQQAPAAIDMAKLTSGERALVVGHVAEWPPFYLSEGPAGPVGLDADIVRAVAKRASIRWVEFRAMTFAELPGALESGRIDVIANGFWVLPERQQRFLLTTPYYLKGGLGFLYRRETPFAKAGDLAGKRVASIRGGYVESWIRKHAPTATYLPVNRVRDLVSMLESGKADVVVTFYTVEKYVASHLDAKEPHRLDAVLVEPHHAAYAMRKSDAALARALDDAVLAMWADGSLYGLKKKYLEDVHIEPATTLPPELAHPARP